jgi:hypothetical protein
MIPPRRAVSICALATFGALYACSGTTIGSGGSGSGSATGTVAGTTFTVASEIAINGVADSTSSCSGSEDGGPGMCVTTSSGQGVGVVLTNRAAVTCGLVQGGNPDLVFANFALLELAVTNDSGTVGAGTYDITTASSGASAQFETSTSTCADGVELTATSGSITLTEVSDTTIAGTYDVTFATQGSFTGSFNAPVCDLPDGGLSSSSSSPCQP